MDTGLLGIVISNLSTFVTDKVATHWGVEQQAQKLTGYLSAIHAVLQEAEEQQITSPSVKLWLQKITDAAHVLDDIIEDYSIQHDRQSIGVCAWLTRFHPNNILFRFNLAKRMKDITRRFDAIEEERCRFQFHQARNITAGQPLDDEWRQTTSVIIEPTVYGRDQDREKIVDFLVSQANENEDLSVYPIVGMSGLGKTTLAQLVFNDQRLTPHFDLKIWVCVSNDFKIVRILQSILESTDTQNPNLCSLESLQRKVQLVLQTKKYLLVPDDVWNEDQVKWNKLKSLLQCGSGKKGASILVTTQLQRVASIMGTYPAHHLLGLSEDDNWSLFKHHAFRPNEEEHEELVSIGKEIVTKCAGSPLASKALGSLLRTKREEKQWLSVKESKFWDIPDDNHIMSALRLSYFHLKLSLRRCFSFFAIFPKDEIIEKEALIHLWMANGLISSRGNLEVEDVGNEAWIELYQRSFFQEVTIDQFDEKIKFKMHDLFHDLAQSLTGEECVIFKDASLTDLSSRVHHIVCLNSNQPVDVAAFRKVESIRTFLQIGSFDRLGVPTLRVPSISPLRALCTSAYQFSALNNLTHLRYLNICRSRIITLPESIGKLQKLQILKLEHCNYLHSLPKQLIELQDLRHLVIERCDSIEVMPPNIGKLACLKTLSTFIVGLKTGFGLAELHDLKLGGMLHIKGLENVKSESDAKQANLIDKKDLKHLHLSWSSNANSHGVDHERILEALQPNSNLKSLGLCGYQGTQLPSWIRNPLILKDLVQVILYKCTNCERLPPLGKLPHLTTLRVFGMKDVKYLDDDSYDVDVSLKAFKSLKELTLCKLPNLERMLRDERVEMFPCLYQLIIFGVPKLSLPHLSSVDYLVANGVENVVSFPKEIVRSMPHLRNLRISYWNKLKVLPDELGSLNALESLQIHSCNELECLSDHVLQGLTSLEYLCITECKKLKSLSKGVGHLTCLEHLRIVLIKQDQLPEGLQCIPFLQSALLSVNSLPDWLGDMTSLQELKISMCPELTSLPSSFSQLTNLQKLELNECPLLGSLPGSFSRLSNLQELTIEDCPEIEKRCKRGTGEDWHKIAHIPQITINPREDMTFSEHIRLGWDLVKYIIQQGQKTDEDYFSAEQHHLYYNTWDLFWFPSTSS